jgi:hypothetical protein
MNSIIQKLRKEKLFCIFHTLMYFNYFIELDELCNSVIEKGIAGRISKVVRVYYIILPERR